MTQINWGLGQGGGFQNALAQGYQLGSHIKQRREEGEQRNALAQYATNPTPEGLGALAQYAPEFVIRERERMQQQEQAAQQSGAEGVSQFRPVLEQVQQNPAMWPQARAAAIAGGIDASRIPEAYDPNWVSGQLLFVRAAEDGSLPSIARELQVAGIDVETPQGQQVLRNVIEGHYATEYVDPEGNTRRRSPFSLPSVQQAPAGPPAVGAIEDGYRFRGGNPADPASWEQVQPTMQNTPAPQMSAGGQPTSVTAQQYQVIVDRMGQAEAQAWAQRNNIQIEN